MSARKRLREDEMAEGDSCISINVPADASMRRIIDLMAKSVAIYGQSFERVRTTRSPCLSLFLMAAH
jgi:hypothetical protein